MNIKQIRVYNPDNIPSIEIVPESTRELFEYLKRAGIEYEQHAMKSLL